MFTVLDDVKELFSVPDALITVKIQWHWFAETYIHLYIINWQLMTHAQIHLATKVPV